ncbi:hypothetical protein [Clostridium botulinum]|uniref:hypothetical protein n=1 Tax=Clostridium botulinum TaxID=1491 RepID=UPI0017481A37|nr:hypothetical protein [Clostridium botulinum]MBD5589358.1 hypothetical protein [Clostridium botulinum]
MKFVQKVYLEYKTGESMEFVKSNNDKYVRCYSILQYEIYKIVNGIQIPFHNPKNINDRIIFSVDNSNKTIKPNGKAEFRLISKNIKDNKEINIILVVKSSETDICNIEKENKIIQEIYNNNILIRKFI